jgi:hypothetical protein
MVLGVCVVSFGPLIGDHGFFGDMVDFIEFFNGLLGVVRYVPDYGAGLSGVLFPP